MYQAIFSGVRDVSNKLGNLRKASLPADFCIPRVHGRRIALSNHPVYNKKERNETIEYHDYLLHHRFSEILQEILLLFKTLRLKLMILVPLCRSCIALLS